MSNNITDSVALVTGANRGIGKATAEALLNEGANKVYLAVRNTESTKDLHEKYGDRVETLFVDLSQKSSIVDLAKTASDVDIVVSNAGILEVADPLSDQFETAFEKELSVNVYGLVNMAQAFTPILEQNKGTFVQLNSIASIKNFAGFTSYSASKAAAYSITQGLRELLKPRGVHVVSVHPGPIATDMASDAGMIEMADDVSTVPKGIISAIQSGAFHVFPDVMAKDFENAYKSYAEAIIEPIAEAAH